MKAATQRLPITIEKYFREKLKSGRRGRVLWTDSSPRCTFFKGKTAAHRIRKTVEAPTDLRGILDVLARQARQEASHTSFVMHRRGNRVLVRAACDSVVRPGRPAWVIAEGLVSPLPWVRGRSDLWTNLPEALDTTHYAICGAEHVLSYFTPAQITGPWLWKKADAPSDAQMCYAQLLAFATKMSRARLTLDDIAKLVAFGETLVAKRRRPRRAA